MSISAGVVRAIALQQIVHKAFRGVAECYAFLAGENQRNLFIFLSNHIYWQQHTAKEHSQENIFPYVFPYICYNAARHDVDNREQYHTQAQTQAENSHNMWPVAIIEFYSRHIHAEWAIVKNVYTVFIIKA